MATITLIDLLGTDNVAVSRTDINKNFQTVENSVNTLETYLNTTPAGGALSVGSATLTLGANPIGTNLLVNQGSASIAGNLSVALASTLTGAVTMASDASIAGALTLTGSGITPGLTLGSTATVPFKLQNVVFIEEQLATEGPTTVEVENVVGTGIHEIDITDKRKILLNYPTLPAAADATSANFVRLVGGPVTGQKLWVGINEVSNPGSVGDIYLEITGFNAKYDQLTGITPYNSAAGATDAAVGFTGTLNNEFRRQWVELLYDGATWEVIGAHPSVTGL